MVGGFNTNIRYQGRTFHVQTEDSGPHTPKIVTLLYEGGSILYSRKTSYDATQGPPDSAKVRALMEQQHKEMVEALKEGRLDGEIAGLSGVVVRDETESDTPRRPGAIDTSKDVRALETAPTSSPAAPAAVPKPLGSSPTARAQAAGRNGASSPSARTFGQGVITQKPLDEVVLALLAAK